MAHAAGDALDVPLYGAHFRLVFPIFDADGDLVVNAADIAAPQVSTDCGNWVTCTNDTTEINNGGMYYLDLTGAEMSGKVVAVRITTSTSGAKTTPIVLYPKRLPVLETGTAQAGAAGTITLSNGASAQDDFYNGCFLLCTNNDPAGVQYQARRIVDYVGSTRVASVDSNWGTNPTSATTYTLLVPETTQVAGWAGVPLAAYDTAGYPKVTLKSGTGTGEISLSSGVANANAVQVSGDATAADNLETMLDGTGGQTLSLGSLIINNASGPAVEIDGTTNGLTINASGGHAVTIASTGGNGAGVSITGNGSGDGLNITGGATGDGMSVSAGATSGEGLYLFGRGAGKHGLMVEADAGHAIYAVADTGNYHGAYLNGVGTGVGLKLTGGITNAVGLDINNGGTGTGIDTTTLAEIADAVLVREFDAVTEPVDTRNLLNAARFLRNKWTISGTDLSVKKEDDSTEAWAATVTATAGANPITANDPA